MWVAPIRDFSGILIFVAPKTRRPKIGDVFELRVKDGFAYIQYSHKHTIPPRFGTLVRVLPGVFAERPQDVSAIVNSREVFFQFIWLAHDVRAGNLTFLGNFELPVWCSDFPLFRDGIINPKTGAVHQWWLWDGSKEWMIKELTDAQRHLSLRRICDIEFLRDLIDTGWTPLDAK